MIESTPDGDTRLIPTSELGQRGNRGRWATAACQNGECGVMLGVTQSEDHSAGIFIPEARFAEFRPHLTRDHRELFESAVQRLPAFKARLRALEGAS